jgi:membrane protein implicated in regulation of membrane protease activity
MAENKLYNTRERHTPQPHPTSKLRANMIVWLIGVGAVLIALVASLITNNWGFMVPGLTIAAIIVIVSAYTWWETRHERTPTARAFQESLDEYFQDEDA